MDKQQDKIAKALEIAFDYASYDGSHHKTWCIDQMVRALTESRYESWVAKYEEETDEDGEVCYSWDTGIAP